LFISVKDKDDVLIDLIKVKINLLRGRVVIENGEHIGKAGDGQFLKRGECVKI